MHPAGHRQFHDFAYLNFDVVRMLHDLPEVAHVDQCAADWAIAEMIGLGVGDAVSVYSKVRYQTHASGLPLIETPNRRAILSIPLGFRPVRRAISSSVIAFARVTNSRSAAIECTARPLSFQAIWVSHLQLRSDG